MGMMREEYGQAIDKAIKGAMCAECLAKISAKRDEQGDEHLCQAISDVKTLHKACEDKAEAAIRQIVG